MDRTLAGRRLGPHPGRLRKHPRHRRQDVYKRQMLILAVESSCDETAVALVRDGRTVLADCIASSVEMHKLYGGVVPEIASRKHIEVISQLADQALAQAGVTRGDIDAVAVTYAPGLIGAVLVGVSFAKMCIRDRDYLALCLQGEGTIPQRKEMLAQKQAALLASIQELEDSVAYIHWKQSFYDEVLSGQRDVYKRQGPGSPPGECPGWRSGSSSAGGG